jgi:Ca2+-transporting ATPase
MEYFGLRPSEIDERIKRFGKNEIVAEERFSVSGLFISQFLTLINGILFLAGVISMIVHDVIDGVFIFAVIFLNAVFGFIQEYRAQKSLEKLKHYTVHDARVIREGKEGHIAAWGLVPDDLVVLSEGDRIPADGILLESHHLEIDESILTGESLPVSKNQKEQVFLGTLITKGKGIFQVTEIGEQTQFGKIAKTLSSIETDKTPLQKSLDQLGKTLSFGAVAVGLLIIPIGIFYHEPLIPVILVAASIGIAAIPEGLPAVITIALAVGTHRMAKRGAIVRKMPAVETLGSVQVVLVDKTGTITQNVMRVKKSWVAKKEYLSHLVLGCILGNTAALLPKGDGKGFEVLGDRTDGALLLWAREQGKDEGEKAGKVLDEFVFDSRSKTIATVWEEKNKKYVFVRGAPEAVLERCVLSAKDREEAVKMFEEMAKAGLRTIGFGMKTEIHPEQKSREHLEQHLTFLGILGVYDPPRPEVTEAIEKAHSAGIRVLMVTGDNELTALALSKEVGLIEKDEDVLTGAEMEQMSDEDLSTVLTKTRVFARTKPEGKLRIATLLQQQGYVVGVTGDGVNDALALKQADVGIAMGESGTDVAKEASDIVLTDDNFATLIRTVEEGRIIYKNIINAIIYLISGNLGELSLVFLAALFRLPFPLLPTQILWINLVTDSLPALALAVGSKDHTVLTKKPRDPKQRILTWTRILYIFVIGFSLSGILLSLFAFLLRMNTEAQARTVVFNLLIYFHLLIVMWIGRHSLRKGNIFLVGTVLLILVIQISLNFIPVTEELLHLVH